jgi:hypothetical protein
VTKSENARLLFSLFRVKKRLLHMTMNIRELWRGITATRYTRALEAEVARLRAENRALLNSILGIAGVPPITVIPDSVSIGAQAIAAELRQAVPAGVTQPARASKKMNAANGYAKDVNAVTPMRRRSWHQIYRMLEIDSARKKPTRLDGQDSAGKPQETVNLPPAYHS